MWWTFLILLAGLLSSCAKPVERFDGTYVPAVRPAALTPEPIDLERRLTLADLIDIALERSPETKQGWYRAKAAAAALGAAKGSLYPQIALQADGVHTRTFEFVGGPAITDYRAQAAATLSYLLLDFGERRASIQEAKENLRIANWSRDWKVQQILMQLLGRYYEYIDAKGLLEAQERAEQDASARVTAVEDLWNAGLIGKSDVLAAKSDWVQTKLRLSQRKRTAIIAMAALASAMGVEPDARLQIEDVPKGIDRSAIAGELEGLTLQAKEKRADMLALRAEMAKRNLEIKRTQASLWPKIDALAKSGWAYDQKSPSLNIYNYAVGISLHAPLFEGFKKSYECKRAYADAQATLADVEAKEQEIALDVLSHFETLKASEEAISLSKESLGYAQEAYHAALEQYKAGCLSIFSLIECSKALSLARESEAQADVHWFAAMARLAYATGSLLEQL